MLSSVLFHLRVARTPARPPAGRAMAGSMEMPKTGLRTISSTATSGPAILAINDGKSVLEQSVPSASFISEKPLSGSIGNMMKISAAIPTSAGTMPAAITDDSGAS